MTRVTYDREYFGTTRKQHPPELLKLECELNCLQLRKYEYYKYKIEYSIKPRESRRCPRGVVVWVDRFTRGGYCVDTIAHKWELSDLATWIRGGEW